ncbi:unnamed protein product [Cylicostephanus goldi]|uniref:Calcineurin-like phosphoesterase domain-containing protein n=1 Tax=Cylicostephanus goldi TaxID=71465 RepID=A0A3P7MHN9_CYLGO|nr:unnamed protein product [Cylicostephanus goldi]
MQRGIIAILGLVIFGMAVIGTITSSFVEIDSDPVSEVSIDKAPSDSLRLIVVGDTGGLPVYPYFSYAQKRVAKAMEKVAESKKVQYVINVGDNIYFTGVENEYDPRFLVSFEPIIWKQSTVLVLFTCLTVK